MIPRPLVTVCLFSLSLVSLGSSCATTAADPHHADHDDHTEDELT
jgi:hypothetical protein